MKNIVNSFTLDGNSWTLKFDTNFNTSLGLRSATLVKRRLWHRCFPVNFVKFLRTTFLPLVVTSEDLIIWKKVMPTQVFFQVFFSEPNRLNIIIKISAKYWKNFMLGTSKFQFTSWFYKFQALANIFFSNKRVNSFLFTLSAIQNYIIIKKVLQIKSETNVGFWV